MIEAMEAVVLAAGRGERLHPITLTMPKPLLPIGGKPLADHLLSSLHEAGINEALFVVHHLADQIMTCLGSSRLGIKLRYKEQGDVLGTAHALKVAETHVGDEPFLLIHGDLFVPGRTIKKVIEKYRQERGPCMAVVRVESAGDYGVVDLENGRVVKIVEKPTLMGAGVANAGIYVLVPDIFEELRGAKRSARGEFELTDVIQTFIDGGGEVHGVEIEEEEWSDIGRPWDLLEANRRALLAQEVSIKGKVEKGATVDGPVAVADGALIMSGAYIKGPAYVGVGSKIGPNCYVRPYTSISKHARIGNGCDVKNSIIMNDCSIAHLSYVGDSIIGSGCNLGAGTMIANLRFDDRAVEMTIRGRRVSTGRRKFGVVLGDHTKTGINVSIMPGVKVGPNSWIGPGMVVLDDVPPNSYVFVRHEIGVKKVSR